MRSLLSTVATLACGAAITTGCSQTSVSPNGESRPTTAFEITTAPLNLPGVGFVCYDFRVRNGQGQTVVQRGVPGVSFYNPTSTVADPTAVCSGQFGNATGGDISYIAPCDASLTPIGNEIHTVTIWVDGLYGGTQTNPTAAYTYLDPCPNGCTIPARCVENADTPVTFNLTIMRPAEQGFFDVAVNFNAIFCSAKLDCTYEGESDPITLLHNPDKPGQPRDTTFVVGLACTGGEDSDTHLYMNPGELVCYAGSVAKGVRVNFSTTGLEEGNMRDVPGSFNITTHDLVSTAGGVAWAPPSGTIPGSPFVYQHAYYRGIESLGNYNKVYSNAAYGVDYALLHAYFGTFAGYAGDARCVYSNHATASNGPIPSATNSIYPQVQFCAEVFGGNSVCGQNPLNDPNAAPIPDFNDLDGTMLGGVFTTYSYPYGLDNLSTCAPDVDPPYELCIHPESGELVACDPIVGTPTFELIEEPRTDVAHGATNCDGTPLSVTFTLTEGWAYCRVGHVDDVDTMPYVLCGYPDIGPNTWNFWTTDGPLPDIDGTGNYGTQRLDIMVSDGVAQQVVHTRTWYVHESLDRCCYCDEFDNDGGPVAWPSDQAFFAAATAPMTREEYRWIVAARSQPGEQFPNHAWELPDNGGLDTSVAFGPDTTLLPPIQMISVSDVSVVGLPQGHTVVTPALGSGPVLDNPGYARSFSYGNCTITGGQCTHDVTCKTWSDVPDNTCQGAIGTPLYHKVDNQSNRAFDFFEAPAPLEQFTFEDDDPDDGFWTQGAIRTIMGGHDFGNIIDSAYAGDPRFKDDGRGARDTPTTSFDLELMSLRKRFVLNTNGTLMLITRAVGSRNTFWETGERDCRITLTYGFYANKYRDAVEGGSELYPQGMRRQEITFDAIVINARGQGYGLSVNPATGLPEKVVYSDRMIAKLFRGSIAGRSHRGEANREIMSPKLYDPARFYGTAWQVNWAGADVTSLGVSNPTNQPQRLPVLNVWK